jgi:hypothetical protein
VLDFASNVDGTIIHVHQWLPAEPPRGVVQISHGMGEHAGRYAHLAETLARGLRRLRRRPCSAALPRAGVSRRASGLKRD